MTDAAHLEAEEEGREADALRQPVKLLHTGRNSASVKQ